MVYSINVFSEWKKYETWDALKTWLQSNEGGSLRIVEPSQGNCAIIRYVKDKSNFTIPHVRWCRSVVIDKTSLRPLSVAPPRASVLDPEPVEKAAMAQEFIDGTMINIYEGNGGSVMTSTRSRIGCHPFSEMLDECLKARGVASLEDLLPPKQAEGKTRFASIVLQHPKNRIVTPIVAPNFYMIHQGYVSEDGALEIEENIQNEFAPPSYSLNALRGAKTLDSWIKAQAQEKGFGWQGVVLKSGDGQRWRVRSEVYEVVRRIKGNEQTALERFARLRSTRSMKQYLDFYPEDREALYEMEGALRKNTRHLLQLYTDTFRMRKIEYHVLPWPYKHHVSVLHNAYKDVLKGAGGKVDLAYVVNYVNNLSLVDLVNMVKGSPQSPQQPPLPSTLPPSPTPPQ
jgi:hypothetical protein